MNGVEKITVENEKENGVGEHRVVHGLDGPAGRVTILPDFGGSGRVSTSDLLVFY